MGNGLDILSVNDYGQLSVGDSLIIQRAQGDMYFAQVKECISRVQKQIEEAASYWVSEKEDLQNLISH